MKTITFREYISHMRREYHDYEDCNNFYNIVLDVFKSLRRQDKQYYNDIEDLLSMTSEDRLAYRTAMAEEGKELTPVHVDQLIKSMQYAKERAEQTL